MTDALGTEEAQKADPPSRWLRVVKVLWIPTMIALAVAMFISPETHTLAMPDGSVRHLLVTESHINYQVIVNGERSQRRYLWVKYYTVHRDVDSMRMEADTVAQIFCTTADSLGLASLKIDPTKPLLGRFFRWLWMSRTFWFDTNDGRTCDPVAS